VSPPPSSLTSQTSTQLDTVPEEEEEPAEHETSIYLSLNPSGSLNPSVYRSADDEMKKNVAYGHCGAKKGEDGEEKTDVETENGETKTSNVL
jgi:hypothetical protein